MKRLHSLLMTTALLFSGSAALAAINTQGVIDSLSAAGYTRIEVKTGPTQTKVEAIRGTEKLEQVFDAATGALLKSEVETVRPGEDTAPGITIRDRKRDFVKGQPRADDENDQDDDSAAGSDDDDDENNGRGRGRGRGGNDASDGDDSDDHDGDEDDGDGDDGDGDDGDGDNGDGDNGDDDGDDGDDDGDDGDGDDGDDNDQGDDDDGEDD